METQVHWEHETRYVDFEHLTWYNSSHFIISGAWDLTKWYIINANGWGDFKY